MSLKKRLQIENDEKLVPVFQDEVHFNIVTSVTRTWCRKGSNPKVKSFPGRQKVSYSGFIIPQTGELFVSKPEKFNYKSTIDSVRLFLEAHPAPKGKKYTIVMDNAPWHKKAIRLIQEDPEGEYADISQQICFLKLPPYSPDLNPIEQVWRVARRENVHNVYFRSRDMLERTMDDAFSVWKLPNSKLQTLCSFK